MGKHTAEYQQLIGTLARQASEHVESRYIEPKTPATDGPRFSLRGGETIIPARKTDEEKKPAASGRISLYSIQDQNEPLDSALREVSRGGDTVRALSYLSRSREKTFSEQLFEYIDASGRDNAEIYKAAGIDRRLFSKIQSDREYKPSKDTCISLALALNLEEEKAKSLLSKAGFALSRSSKRDLIIEFFFRYCQYDLDTVNGVLERLGERTLGKIDYGK